MSEITIAIDVMGGDFGPPVTVPAIIDSIAQLPQIRAVLVGDPAAIDAHLPNAANALSDRYETLASSVVVTPEDSLSAILRHKKDSSMALALGLVKSGTADACLSAGSTAALMVLARSILGMLEGIDRPALITEIPTLNTHCHVLDLGANIGCDAENLYQFAMMGAVAAGAVDNIARPRVALLNVGQEHTKGTSVVKQAATLISEQSELNYVGFVEGDHIFSDIADVIVCDGFVGNVALKTSEGLAKMIGELLQQVFSNSLLTLALGKLCRPILTRVANQIDPKRHNGASLLGLDGIVVKSHGNADHESFKQAFRRAVIEVEKNLPQQITLQFAGAEAQGGQNT